MFGDIFEGYNWRRARLLRHLVDKTRDAATHAAIHRTTSTAENFLKISTVMKLRNPGIE